MANSWRISMVRWRSHVLALLILEVFSATELTDAQAPKWPLNAAANVGDRVTIECTSNSSVLPQLLPQWKYRLLDTDSPRPISAVGVCTSLIPERFEVQTTGPGNCNLIIPNATTAEALAYQCTDSLYFDRWMLLTIIESVEVYPNSEVEELCPDDPLNITCSVKYSAVSTPTLQMLPSIMWTNLSGNANISGTTTSPMPPKIMTSYLSITASLPTVPPYSCNVYFNAPNVSLSDCATNAPIYYRSMNTTELNVQCNALDASSISVTSYNESGICEAKILECHFNAYPPPHDIHWLDVIRNETFNGTRITAEFGGEYICSVTNAINGNNRTANVTYKLNDDSGFTMNKCKGVSEVNITQSTNIASKISKVENANAYSCGDATKLTENVTVTCKADGLPNATYVWYDECQNQTSTGQQTIVTTLGSYKCVANNSVNGRNFIGSNTIEITPPADVSQGSTSADGWILLLLLLLLLLFVFPACVFLLWYGCSKSCRENVNEEFPWIEKALPCMNEKGCECSGGMVLFIFCLVICGIIFVPWILIASHCCRKNSKKSQRDSISLHERNGSRNDRHQSGASTGEAPSQAPPPRPNSMHQTQVDPFHNSHVNSPHSRPPPPSKRAMNSSSPVSASGVEYGELKIDAKPGSRKPVELIIQKESAYAELQTS